MNNRKPASTTGVNARWMETLQEGRKKPRRKAAKKDSGKTPPCDRYRDVLLASVATPVETVPPTMTYRISVAVVGILMLLLPGLYVATAVASVVIWYLHCTRNLQLLTAGAGGALLYIVPAFFGPFVIFFLFKPFFVRGTPGSQQVTLKREDEPVLYEFVEQLCRSVGAPVPERICINMLVNASAGFSSANPFSRRLTLTVGLPLIYRLTLRQMAGVLSHEFGHFSQRFGMRFSYVVRSINHWLSGALGARDLTDDLLENRLGGSRWYHRIARWLLFIGVSVARSVIWCFLTVSNALSCLLLRQMELNADRVEVAMVGDKAFTATHRRIIALSVAEQFAHSDLHDFFEDGRLVDDFPKLIASSLDEMTVRLRKAIDEHESKQETAWFDTHPSQQARFDNVAANACDGAFQVPTAFEKVAATVLFRDVSRHAEECSTTFYQAVLGRQFNEGLLYPIDELLERRKAETTAARTLHRYFQVSMPPFYPFPIAPDAVETCDDPKEVLAELKSQRKEMLRCAKPYRRLIERHACAEHTNMEAAALAGLTGANVRVRIALPTLLKTSVAEFARMAESGLGNLALEMLDYEAAAGRRISAALRLATHRKVWSAMPDGEKLRDDASELVTHTLQVTELMADLRGVRVMCQRAIIALNHIDGNLENFEFLDLLFRQVGGLYEMIKKLHWEMGSYEYPFDHAEGEKSLQEFVMPDLPPENDPYAMLYVARMAFERLATTQMRLFARLAVIAEQVETHLGFSELPDYDPADDVAAAAA